MKKNRGIKIINYLEEEISCLKNWVAAQPQCNKKLLLKNINTLKKAQKILRERTND